jgi:hypothetical protein
LPHAAAIRTRANNIRMMRASYSYGFTRRQLRWTKVPTTVSLTS